jgi:hypothetical protein
VGNARLFNFLVPDAPSHRRTERDILPTDEFAARAQLENFLIEAAVKPTLREPSLVSSYRGTIDTVLFAFPAYAIDSAELVAGYKSVIAALRKGTRFVALHQKSIQAKVQSWFSAAGHATEAVTYVPLADYVSFTDWAEDAYVCVINSADGSSHLVEPWEFLRGGDALIADTVEQYSDIGATQAPLIFQGGNCLIGDKFWFLGKDYFADSSALLQKSRPPVQVPDGMTPEQFVRQLFKEYIDAKRELTIIGTEKPLPLRAYYGSREGKTYYLDVASEGAGTYQPIFHIDMFLTLIGPGDDGKFEVLVGDPKLADQLLGTNSKFALIEVYDKIAKDLSSAGMRVHRNPLVHRASLGKSLTLAQLAKTANEPGNEALGVAVKDLTAAGAKKTTPVKVRSWHHITWNNCLVENSRANGKHVYLPTFGHGRYTDLKKIDAEMKSLWEKFGFQVHLLADFNEFARRQGVVHCIKKYIKRSD